MSASARRRSARASVKVRSVRSRALAFCTMVSTLTPASASGSKMRAATPRSSGTARSVTLAMSWSSTTPRTRLRSSMRGPPWMRVPGASTMLEATRMGRPWWAASSTARLCITRDPCVAISSISS